MKIAKKTKSTRKIVLITAVIILFCAAGVGTALYLKSREQGVVTKQSPDQEKLSNRAQGAGTQDSQSVAQDAKDKQSYLDGQKDPGDPATEPILPDDSVSLLVSSDATSLLVKTQIKNFTGSGSCSLIVRKGSVEVSDNAAIIYQPEFSSCAGFAIDRAKLSSGLWSINLTVKSNGVTVQKSIEYAL